MRTVTACVFAFLCAIGAARATNPWTRAGVVLTPTCASQPWECTGGAPLGAVFEPKVLPKDAGCVIVASPCLAMWYSGGWGTCSAGYAETADLSGVTGWTKYASNPIIGQGKLGFAVACRKSVARHPVTGTIFIYFADNVGQPGGRLWVTSSSNGVTGFSTPTLALEPGTIDTSIQNSFVWAEPDSIKMLYESNTADGWQIFHAAARSHTGPWVKINGNHPLAHPLYSLQRVGGGFSNPSVTYGTDSRMHVYLHQSNPIQNLPTMIYHTCEPVGLLGMKVANGGAAIITPLSSGWFDQVGDAYAIDLQGIGSIFFDDDINTPPNGPYAQISLAKTTTPLANVSCP